MDTPPPNPPRRNIWPILLKVCVSLLALVLAAYGATYLDFRRPSFSSPGLARFVTSSTPVIGPMAIPQGQISDVVVFMGNLDISDKDLDFSSRFPKEKSTFINLQYELTHPARDDSIPIPLRVVLYGPDEQIISDVITPTKTAPNTTHTHWRIAVGNSKPGNWATGLYRFEIYAEKELVSTAGFEIIP